MATPAIAPLPELFKSFSTAVETPTRWLGHSVAFVKEGTWSAWALGIIRSIGQALGVAKDAVITAPYPWNLVGVSLAFAGSMFLFTKLFIEKAGTDPTPPQTG